MSSTDQIAQRNIGTVAPSVRCAAPDAGIATEITHACGELDAAAQVYEFNRRRNDLLTRNTKQERLRHLIIGLSSHVQACCKGDRRIVMSAGFETKRKRSASEPLDRLGDLRAKRSDYPGCIDLRWAGVKHNRLYSVWVTDGDPGIERGWRPLTRTTKN